MKKTTLEHAALENLLQLAKQYEVHREQEVVLQKKPSGELYFLPKQKNRSLWRLFKKKPENYPLENFTSIYGLFRLIYRFSQEEIKQTAKSLDLHEGIASLEQLKDMLDTRIRQSGEKHPEIIWRKERKQQEQKTTAFPFHVQYALARFEQHTKLENSCILDPIRLRLLDQATALRNNIEKTKGMIEKTKSYYMEQELPYLELEFSKRKACLSIEELQIDLELLEKRYTSSKAHCDLEKFFYLLGTKTLSEEEKPCLDTIERIVAKDQEVLQKIQQRYIQTEKNIHFLCIAASSFERIKHLQLVVHTSLRYTEQRVQRKSSFLNYYYSGCIARIHIIQDSYEQLVQDTGLLYRLVTQKEEQSIQNAIADIENCLLPPKEIITFSSAIDRLHRRAKNRYTATEKNLLEKLQTLFYHIGKEGYSSYHMQMADQLVQQLTSSLDF